MSEHGFCFPDYFIPGDSVQDWSPCSETVACVRRIAKTSIGYTKCYYLLYIFVSCWKNHTPIIVLGDSSKQNLDMIASKHHILFISVILTGIIRFIHMFIGIMSCIGYSIDHLAE